MAKKADKKKMTEVEKKEKIFLQAIKQVKETINNVESEIRLLEDEGYPNYCIQEDLQRDLKELPKMLKGCKVRVDLEPYTKAAKTYLSVFKTLTKKLDQKLKEKQKRLTLLNKQLDGLQVKLNKLPLDRKPPSSATFAY